MTEREFWSFVMFYAAPLLTVALLVTTGGFCNP